MCDSDSTSQVIRRLTALGCAAGLALSALWLTGCGSKKRQAPAAAGGGKPAAQTNAPAGATNVAGSNVYLAVFNADDPRAVDPFSNPIRRGPTPPTNGPVTTNVAPRDADLTVKTVLRSASRTIALILRVPISGSCSQTQALGPAEVQSLADE
jgi:hypothetical protein